MKCFYNNDACHGPIEPAGGHTDSLWLNGAVDRESGYCEGHRNKALFSARWEMGRVFQLRPEGHVSRSHATTD
jgi:hypothetical protein